jgi:hypothetical protein
MPRLTGTAPPVLFFLRQSNQQTPIGFPDASAVEDGRLAASKLHGLTKAPG